MAVRKFFGWALALSGGLTLFLAFFYEAPDVAFWRWIFVMVVLATIALIGGSIIWRCHVEENTSFGQTKRRRKRRGAYIESSFCARR